MEELTPGRVENLHETYLGGIRKTLWWSQPDNRAWVSVEDDFGDTNFVVDVPPLPTNPLEFMTHIMLHAPTTGKRKLYATTEEDQHVKGSE